MMVAPCFWRQLDESQSTETETLTISRDKTNERPTFTRGSEWMAACLAGCLNDPVVLDRILEFPSSHRLKRTWRLSKRHL